MKIELKEGLLQASVTMTFNGKSKKIDNVVIDTGASHTIISSDIVDDIGVYWTPDDEIIDSVGIGGTQNSFVKNVDKMEFAGELFAYISIDFGCFDSDLEINGLIGLDILLAGRFVIDLTNLNILPITKI